MLQTKSKGTVGAKYFHFMHLYSYSRLEHPESSEGWKSERGLHHSTFSVNGPKIAKKYLRYLCFFIREISAGKLCMSAPQLSSTSIFNYGILHLS